MPRRLAVTGGSGFVGRHLLALARAEGVTVAAVVRSAAAARVVDAAGGEPRPASLLDRAGLEAAFAGAEALVHLAHVAPGAGARHLENAHVEATRAVLEAARAAGIDRFVCFSGLGVAHYGLRPRVTDRYFLSKLLAEAEAFRSGLGVTVFRPSYIVGPGDALVGGLLRDLASGALECPGDGSYRLQPVAVADAAEAALRAALAPPAVGRHRVIDLVGPSPVTYLDFLGRLRDEASRQGRAGASACSIRTVPVEEADAAARAPGGFHGMRPGDLDCLLCDEVSDAAPLRSLLGRDLAGPDEALARAVAGTPS
jgi:NADH dehydrogenase